ncbi:MAG TPA: tail fiber domain-containing protein [Xanthobacteraceae bacterium]
MTIRRFFLSTTMLSGVVGPAFLSGSANAVDYSALRAPLIAPAVDGINSKIEGYGGAIANRSLYGVDGAIGIPLGGQWGAQIDGKGGNLDHRAFGAIAGHLFWRNPSLGLLGVYASYTDWDQFGGVHVSQIGGEAGYYWGRFTLQAVAGAESGSSAVNTTSIVTSGTSTATSTVPPGALPGTITTTTTNSTTVSNFIDSYDVRSRFFDQVNLKYNFTPDWDGYIGHRYLGGKNALALGTELAMPLGRGTMGALFVEGRVGQGDFHGVWGGFKVYFGQRDKSLLARHRQDDPPIWDSLFSILNNHNTSANSLTSSLSSSSSSRFCGPGQRIGPISGSCELAVPSDRFLKRDIALIDRLANGIGIYRYRYLWSDTVYVGVMAQEVAAINPRAVTRAADGFLRVNYAALGLRLLTLSQWQAGLRMTASMLSA